MRERPTQHIPDQEGTETSSRNNSEYKTKRNRKNHELDKAIVDIKKLIERRQKSKIVTQETMNLEFTI